MRRSPVIILAALLLTPLRNVHAAEFVVIGPDLAASSLSDDGRVVVGRKPRDNPQAYIWTRETGVRMLEALHADGFTQALDVSADGSVVVGSSGGEPFVWTETSGMVGLGLLPGSDDGTALAVSANGSTVVGQFQSRNCCPVALKSAYRWTQENGFVEMLPPGMDHSNAVDVSADGSVIVGHADEIGPGGAEGGFIWDEISGFQGFGPIPPGWPNAYPHVVSEDGSVVFGGENSIGGYARRAFRWTAQQGIQPIPGSSDARPLWSALNDATPDGSILVGSTFNGDDGSTIRASIWDEQHGTRDLRSVLISEHGFADADLPTLPIATGISADAKTIIGSPLLENQGGWIIYLDKPLVTFGINGDFNNNGTVDAADYIVWRNGLGTTYTQADYATWRANFGATAASIRASSAAINPAVPEPASATICTILLLSSFSARHRTALRSWTWRWIQLGPVRCARCNRQRWRFRFRWRSVARKIL